VRVRGCVVCLVAATLVACGSTPPPPPQAPPPAADVPDDREPVPDDPPAAPDVVSVGAPERSLPPSTKSYEEALSTPESLDVHDESVHLTDAQLTGPMRGVLAGCRISSRVKITINTAVQNGRAIGVTVSVRFDRPKSSKPSKPPPKAVLKAEAKTAAKIVTCVDRAVRAISWPPSRRRDSFTTEF